jgi:hypothetical protein
LGFVMCELYLFMTFIERQLYQSHEIRRFQAKLLPGSQR